MYLFKNTKAIQDFFRRITIFLTERIPPRQPRRGPPRIFSFLLARLAQFHEGLDVGTIDLFRVLKGIPGL